MSSPQCQQQFTSQHDKLMLEPTLPSCTDFCACGNRLCHMLADYFCTGSASMCYSKAAAVGG